MHVLAPGPPGFAAELVSAMGAQRCVIWHDADEALAGLPEAECVLAWRLPAGTRALAQRLRLVHALGAGVDGLLAEVPPEVQVVRASELTATEVCEHAWALILALARRVPLACELQRAQTWRQYTAPGLAGRTLAVLGLGAIGGRVAAIGAAFGMTVLIAARPGASGAVPVDRVPFDEVLTRSDVVSLHCPLTDATRGLINAATLARMKREAWLVNTARGALVDDEALVEALRSRRLGGAALDVLTREPPPAAHPIVRAMPELPTLVVTPHVAWTSREARLRLSEGIADNIHAFLRGERRNRVV